MKALLLPLFFLPTVVSFAHEAVRSEFACEALLDNEFGRTPDDLRNGLVSQRVMLTTEALIGAYRRGIFPWGTTMGGYGLWHRPAERGILDFNDLHVSRSDAKYLRQEIESGELRVSFNEDFKQVLEQCATVPRYLDNPHTGAKMSCGAWITPEFIDAYLNLHYLGYAHSVEVWRGDQMVAGLYGVLIEGVFTGESMFYVEGDATKLALHALIERLKGAGHKFIDTQMALGLAKKWGAKLIRRAEYEKRLRLAQAQNRGF